MIQEKIIKILKSKLSKFNGVNSAILYGSFARKQANVNSDIDIAIQITEKFNPFLFKKYLHDILSEYHILKILPVTARKKIAVYFKDKPKLEITLLYGINELKRNYLGSEIPKELVEQSILFDKTNKIKSNIENWNKNEEEINKNRLIEELINKFMYEFESCSTLHNRSDSYRFYFFYNMALHSAVQLKYLTNGFIKTHYLPRNMTANVITEKNEKDDFYNLSGTIFLRDANQKKRTLLDFFYSSIEKINFKEIKEIKQFLENIYKRDFFWNFRDIAKFNPLVKKGVIFRTSSFTFYQENPFTLAAFLKENGITDIIDLRAEREVEESSYKKDFIQNFNYHHLAFDPWNQPKWFRDTEHYGTNEEIAYRYFAKACKTQTGKIFQTILKAKGAVAIHCFAGKDRTGFIIMLIHLLIGTPYHIILKDYLASELDTTENKLKIYYENIEKEGGIVNYLKSCELSDLEINKLKNKLRK